MKKTAVVVEKILEEKWDELWIKYFSKKIKNDNHFKYLVIILFFIVLIILFFSVFKGTFSLFLVFSPIILPFLYFLWSQKQLTHKTTNDFTINLQKQICLCLSEVFSEKINYLNFFLEKEKTLQLDKELVNSKLINHVHLKNQFTTFDDGYIINLGKTIITIVECSVQIDLLKSKFNTKHVFNGYFAIVELDKTLTGKTFLATEKGAYGADYSLETDTAIKIKTKITEETELEWNKFNELISVSTTNKTEAYYILTPDFMSNLFDWWNDQNNLIRISFIENRVYIIWEDKHMKIGALKENLNKEKVFKITSNLARKIFHLKNLIEFLPLHLNKK